MEVAERIVVGFEGPGEGEEKLSWGQKDIWMAMVRQRNWLPMGGWARLPEGATVETAVAELRYLMSRFQPMRTRLRFGADGEPVQVVSSSGEAYLDVFEAPDEGADELAERLRLWYQDTPYDFENEWPVRMGVIRDQGVATHLIAIMCHLVSDGLGTGFMLADCAARTAEPLDTMQPLEQARWQATAAGQRQNAAALTHWEKTLQSVPSLRFPESGDKPEPRHWRGDFSSPALRLAMHSLTAQSQVDSAQLLLAVVAIAIGRVSEISPVTIRPMVSNRFRPGLSNVVAMVAQFGLCSVDIAGKTFEDALVHVRRATMAAYKYAYYNPSEMHEVIERVSRERGPDFEIGAYFNDRRMQTRQGFPGPVPERQQILDVYGKGKLDWTIKQDDPFEPLILHVDDAPGAMNVVIFMDTHFIAPAQADRLLRAIEEVAVEAAFDPLASTLVFAFASAGRSLA